MTRTLTDPNGDGILEWQERVVDVDGDSISIDLVLDQVNGSNAANSNPSWLGFTTTTNTINTDETEVLVDITADTSGLSAGSTYTFEITADDGIATTSRTFTLEVKAEIIYSGTKLWSCQYDNVNIKVRDLGTRFDISTVQNVNKEFVSNFNLSKANLSDIAFSKDGLTFYMLAFDILGQYDLNTAWDINSNNSETEVTFADNLMNIFFKNDGSKLYATSNYSDVFYWSLSTPWDVTTKGARNDISFSSEFDSTTGGQTRGIHISPDGKKLFIGSGKQVFQYDLGTAWDISTYSLVRSIDISSKFNLDNLANFDAIGFNNDGSKLFLVEDRNYNLTETKLSTNWDISTAVYESQINVGSWHYGFFFGGPSA